MTAKPIAAMAPRLAITAIVVTLGSGLLLLGGSELVIDQIVIGWPVVAAALGVRVDAHANGAGSPTGVGYVELTGYAQSGPSRQ